MTEEALETLEALHPLPPDDLGEPPKSGPWGGAEGITTQTYSASSGPPTPPPITTPPPPPGGD